MKNLQVIENQNKRVILTSQLAECYETSDRRISENFNSNKQRYQEYKHYFCLEGEKLRQFKNQYGNSVSVGERASKLYLWTEKGALLHAKSLNTDKAWEMYDKLVDTYFKAKNMPKLSTFEIMKLQMQAMEELGERIDVVENKVDKQITLDHGQQRSLQNIISKRVYERLGQIVPCTIKDNKACFFGALYKDLKNCFGVASYRDILVMDYINAINYVQAWIEPAKLRSGYEI